MTTRPPLRRHGERHLVEQRGLTRPVAPRMWQWLAGGRDCQRPPPRSSALASPRTFRRGSVARRRVRRPGGCPGEPGTPRSWEGGPGLPARDRSRSPPKAARRQHRGGWRRRWRAQAIAPVKQSEGRGHRVRRPLRRHGRGSVESWQRRSARRPPTGDWQLAQHCGHVVPRAGRLGSSWPLPSPMRLRHAPSGWSAALQRHCRRACARRSRRPRQAGQHLHGCRLLGAESAQGTQQRPDGVRGVVRCAWIQSGSARHNTRRWPARPTARAVGNERSGLCSRPGCRHASHPVLRHTAGAPRVQASAPRQQGLRTRVGWPSRRRASGGAGARQVGQQGLRRRRDRPPAEHTPPTVAVGQASPEATSPEAVPTPAMSRTPARGSPAHRSSVAAGGRRDESARGRSRRGPSGSVAVGRPMGTGPGTAVEIISLL